MKKYFLIVFLCFGVCLLTGQTALSDEADGTDTEPATEITDSEDPDENPGSRFYSRDLLVQTLLSGQPAVVEEQEDSGSGDEGSSEGESGETDTGSENEEAGDETSNEGDTGTEDQEAAVPTSEERIAAFVDSLSNEQVFAFNRALNNAIRSQLYSYIIYDLDLLESLDVATLSSREINAITKALEEEAKFTKLYEQTGNEKFLAKAESQKQKFLAKAGIETDEEPTSDETVTETGDSSINASIQAGDIGAAREAAKFAAKNAKREAKIAAKEAKKEAKLAAREARNTARSAAKEAKNEAKENKGKGKGKNKDK